MVNGEASARLDMNVPDHVPFISGAGRVDAGVDGVPPFCLSELCIDSTPTRIMNKRSGKGRIAKRNVLIIAVLRFSPRILHPRSKV